MGDDELRQLDRDMVNELVQTSSYRLQKHVLPVESHIDADKVCECFAVWMGLKFVRSPFLQARMSGLHDINRMIELTINRQLYVEGHYANTNARGQQTQAPAQVTH